MTYDPVTYWTDRGKTFASEHPENWNAEDPALSMLLGLIPFDTVLDLGCGYGRIAANIARLNPMAAYTGVDVSPDLVATTQSRFPDAEVICSDLAIFTSDRQWDLVLAISVLGHLHREDVGAVLDRMRTWARRDLVVMDWDETGQSTAYQYAHDYRALMPNARRTAAGNLSIYHEQFT